MMGFRKRVLYLAQTAWTRNQSGREGVRGRHAGNRSRLQVK